MSLNLPHKEDLDTNSKLPGYLAEDFKVIEQAINDIDQRLTKVEAKKKDDDDFMKHLYD